MLPRMSSKESQNCAVVDAILLGQGRSILPTGCVLGANLPDLCFGKFSAMNPFAAWGRFGMRVFARTLPSWLASFAQHIVAIVLGRSQEEMCGINARGIITVVADQKTVGDRAVSNHPRNTMTSKGDGPQRDLPVSPCVGVPEPVPAFFRSFAVNVGPESVNVLRGQRWDAKVCFRHGSLLTRGLCLERCGGSNRPSLALLYRRVGSCQAETL